MIYDSSVTVMSGNKFWSRVSGRVNVIMPAIKAETAKKMPGSFV